MLFLVVKLKNISINKYVCAVVVGGRGRSLSEKNSVLCCICGNVYAVRVDVMRDIFIEYRLRFASGCWS